MAVDHMASRLPEKDPHPDPELSADRYAMQHSKRFRQACTVTLSNRERILQIIEVLLQTERSIFDFNSPTTRFTLESNSYLETI